MKMRLLLTLAGLAISFAVPTFAQQKDTVDPEVHQQIEAVDMKLGEAQHKHDVGAIAGLFTQDAIQVLDWSGGGTFSGQQAIEKRYADDFASSPPESVDKLVQVYAIGDEIFATYEWSAGPWKGYSLKIYVRDADTWKIRMEYAILGLAGKS
jgi:ketosteroid isomerase-like protein